MRQWKVLLRFPSVLCVCADWMSAGNVALSVFHEPTKSIPTTELNALCEICSRGARKFPAAPALPLSALLVNVSLPPSLPLPHTHIYGGQGVLCDHSVLT